MSGMLQALSASDAGGDLFMFTDASSLDSHLAGNVASLAASKEIEVYPMAFGSCSPIDPAYRMIADRTGGQLFELFVFEAGEIARLASLPARAALVHGPAGGPGLRAGAGRAPSGGRHLVHVRREEHGCGSGHVPGRGIGRQGLPDRRQSLDARDPRQRLGAGDRAAAAAAGNAARNVRHADGDRREHRPTRTAELRLIYRWTDASGAVVGTQAIVDLTAPLGAQIYTLTVEDGRGGTASATVTVTVRDTVAPQILALLIPPILYPANNRLVTVDATVLTRDACTASPQVRLVSVVSNPDPRRTADDIQGAAIGTDDRSFRLRAEKNRHGIRIYTATYRATDAAGNARTANGYSIVLGDDDHDHHDRDWDRER
jgi:hypothetical protein